MAYIGKDPAQIKRALNEKDTFTGDGSTVAFDLTSDASGANEIQVFVDNIRQEPGASDAYTLGEDGSGNLRRITFTAAPDSGAEIYVLNPKTTDSNLIVPSDNSVTEAKIATGAVTSTKILDGTIVNADINACAAISDTKLGTISTACKVATSAISQPGSSGVYLAGDGSWGAIDTTQQDTNAFNISLLGFKMAVNEGLTVFNLVDGVVDEFNDESGTDEAEGSNDLYCATSDFYQNLSSTPGCFSAGFSMTTITEPDTSTAGTNPTQGTGTMGNFSVPTGMTSASVYVWGTGGGGSSNSPNIRTGGGGGFTTGTLAVTAGQTLHVTAGEGGESVTPAVVLYGGFLGGGSNGFPQFDPSPSPQAGGSGGGVAGVFNTSGTAPTCFSAPNVFIVSGGGGSASNDHDGGSGGGLTGYSGSNNAGAGAAQTNTHDSVGGGGGDQEQGGQSLQYPGSYGEAEDGAFLEGGDVSMLDAPGYALHNHGAGGAGYYGGGAAARGSPNSDNSGGGGSSYYGHPQITCGATTAGAADSNGGGGTSSPLYVAGTNEGGQVGGEDGEDGYVLITGSGCIPAPGGSSTIVSTAFTATSVPTTARIVVFEEDVDTPTLNTDVIASISRDGGSTFTNATLTDSGYVTGSSGQRILTGQATISGQPSGQSMRWKLALANNTVKIHGVSLQWA